MKVHSFGSFDKTTQQYSCRNCNKKIDVSALKLGKPGSYDQLQCEGGPVYLVEQDGYVTVHPVLVPTAATVEANIAEAVEGVVEAGGQPLCVRVDVANYKALLSRNGLERRSLRVWNADSLRARVHGFDLPVEADIRVPADDAWVYTVNLPTGRA